MSMHNTRQIDTVITTPDPGSPGSAAWTNPANIRDSGDPPVLDGTDATFANCTVSSPPTATIRFGTPAYANAPGAVWVGVTIDWEIVSSGTGNEGLTAYARVAGKADAFLSTMKTLGRVRRTYAWPTDYRGSPVSTASPFVVIFAGLFAGTVITARIYEVGVILAARAETSTIDG